MLINVLGLPLPASFEEEHRVTLVSIIQIGDLLSDYELSVSLKRLDSWTTEVKVNGLVLAKGYLEASRRLNK